MGGYYNYDNTYIGSNSTATNNLLNVYGSGVVLSNSTNVYVGYGGSSNSLVISNGGAVVDSNGYIGYGTNSSNNSVVVTGTGSIWSNSQTITIGSTNGGGGNSLTVKDGGAVLASWGIKVQSGTLGGNGTIGGATTITSGGNLTPGFSGTGALTFTQGLTLQSGSTTAFQINTSADFTSINILGNNITYGGNLVFNILNYTPAAGDIFTLFNMTGGATYNGDFENVTAGTLSFVDNGGIWSANDGSYLYQFRDSTGRLTVQTAPPGSVPEPSTYALFGLGAVGLLMVVRRINLLV